MSGQDPFFSSLREQICDEAALRGFTVWQLVTWILRGYFDGLDSDRR